MTEDESQPGGRSQEFVVTIPEDYLQRIAKITVAWGTLEGAGDLALIKLGGFGANDPRSAIFTAHMAWPMKMDILEALVTSLSDDYPHLSQIQERQTITEGCAARAEHSFTRPVGV